MKKSPTWRWWAAAVVIYGTWAWFFYAVFGTAPR